MHEKRTISADDGRSATTPGFASARLAALRARRRPEPTEASAPPSEGGRSEGSPEADAAVALWRRGLRPVPLTPIGAASWRPGGGVEESDGKDPIGRDWAARPFASEGEIRAIYGARPGAGVGLALGLSPDGGDGPIDVEVDDPNAAAATLAAIFGPAGPPPTAGWASARGEHWVYLMTPGDAGRLLAAGIHQATLDGRNHACLAGLEIRLGTLDPGRPKQTQSVVPPTATRGKDGSVSPRRRWIGAGAGFAPMPGALLDYLVGNLGSRPAATAAVRRVPDRDGLEGLTPLEKFAAQIGKLGLGRSACGDGFACRCPAHLGERNNLQFAEGDDCRLLVHCKRGCTFAEVLAAVGLAPAEAYYYPGPRRRSSPRGPRERGCTKAHEITEEQRARLHFADEKAYEALAARPEKLRELGVLLGVSVESLGRLGVGWRQDVELADGKWVGNGAWAWTFPEVDGYEEVVGMLRRYEDGGRGKRLIAGGRRGLTVPSRWREMPGPICVVEGASDVAALLTVGLCAVGRPNNRDGADDLAVLLDGDPRDVVVYGERDAGPDGHWPGDPRPFARELARRLARPIEHRLPPEPHKDLRAFVNARLTGGEAAR